MSPAEPCLGVSKPKSSRLSSRGEFRGAGRPRASMRWNSNSASTVHFARPLVSRAHAHQRKSRCRWSSWRTQGRRRKKSPRGVEAQAPEVPVGVKLVRITVALPGPAPETDRHAPGRTHGHQEVHGASIAMRAMRPEGTAAAPAGLGHDPPVVQGLEGGSKRVAHPAADVLAAERRADHRVGAIARSPGRHGYEGRAFRRGGDAAPGHGDARHVGEPQAERRATQHPAQSVTTSHPATLPRASALVGAEGSRLRADSSRAASPW